jgi:hypothetical protein
MRARRLRSNDEETVAEEQHGTATSSDSVDVQLRSLDGDASSCVLKKRNRERCTEVNSCSSEFQSALFSIKFLCCYLEHMFISS